MEETDPLLSNSSPVDASELSKRRTVAKRKHTIMVREVNGLLASNRSTKQQILSAQKGLETLFQNCSSAHQQLISAPDYVRRAGVDDAAWINDVKLDYEICKQLIDDKLALMPSSTAVADIGMEPGLVNPSGDSNSLLLQLSEDTWPYAVNQDAAAGVPPQPAQPPETSSPINESVATRLALSGIRSKKNSISYHLASPNEFLPSQQNFRDPFQGVVESINEFTDRLATRARRKLPVPPSDLDGLSSVSSGARRELEEKTESLQLTRELMKRVHSGAQAARERAILEEKRANETQKKADEDRENSSKIIRELQEKLLQSERANLEKEERHRQEQQEIQSKLVQALIQAQQYQKLAEETAKQKDLLEQKREQDLHLFSNRFLDLTKKNNSASPTTNPLLYDNLTWTKEDGLPARTRTRPSVEAAFGLPKVVTPTPVDGFLSSHKRSSIFRIPKTDIEIFDGDPTKWSAFSASYLEVTAGLSPAEKSVVLRRLLTQDIKNSLGDTLNNPNLIDQAWIELQNIYGNPHIVSRAYVRTLMKMRRVTSVNDYDALAKMSHTIRGAIASLKAGGYYSELESSTTLECVLEKIPSELLSKWGKKVVKNSSTILTICEFSDWLNQVVRSEMVVRSARQFQLQQRGEAKREDSRKDNRTKILSVSSPEKQDKVKSSPSKVCPLCKQDHRLNNCKEFGAKKVEERSSLVKSLGLCLRCMGKGHIKKDCNSKVRCNVDKCGGLHHALLHGAPILTSTPKKDLAVSFKKPKDKTGIRRVYTKSSDSEAAKAEDSDSSLSARVRDDEESPVCVLVATIPITVIGPNGTVDTFALLDDGSEGTMIKRSLAHQLGLEGPESSKRFSWFDGSSIDMKIQKVSFKLTDRDQNKVFNVKSAYAVEDINISRKRIDWPLKKKQHSHLADLDLAATDHSKVTVLIGRDVRDVHDILEYRKPPEGSDAPEAIRTHFGWCIVGPIYDSVLSVTDTGTGCNRIQDTPTNDALNQTLQKFWEIEAIGTSEQSPKKKYTDMEQRAIFVLDSTARRTGNEKEGFWEIGLLLKSDDFVIHNNRDDALRQLLRLERQLEKNADDQRMYHAFMKDLIDLGFCKEVDVSETEETTMVYYLKHHGVKHPHKPNKIRVVFNASAKFKGVSLNDLLLTGPNLMNGAVEVLIGLRLRPVAVGCDIAKHYHQVRVPVKQQSLLRFVYRPSLSDPIKDWQMTRRIFGGKDSPCAAIYALKRTAEDCKRLYPLAAKILDKNSYVDNILFSTETEAEAIQLCKDIKTVSRYGGFTQTQFTSSSKKVLASLDPSELSKPDLDLDCDDLPTERTLGVNLDFHNDVFKFQNCLKERKIHTKRSVLSDISSIFDPLGLILPIILVVRVLMQDIWRSGIDWDDALPAGLLSIWLSWAASLSALPNLNIPRCIRRVKEPVLRQLHIFCDASEKAYGACAYQRSDYGADGVDLRLIMAKARVAPLKQQSIPRLELMAAHLAAHLADFLVKVMELNCEVILWSDSQTVLQWLHAVATFFHAFVSSRRTTILELTQASQWRHVPGELNPADDVSRGISADHLPAKHRWFVGPPFLYMPEEMWPPKLPFAEPSLDDVEVSPRSFVGTIRLPEKHKILLLAEKVSSLLKLKRCVAWLFRALRKLEARPQVPSSWLMVAELNDALQFIIRIDQRHHFLPELRAIANKEVLPPTSVLHSFTPFFDVYGILRVGGRLNKSPSLTEDQKHPILLHHNSRIARLVIDEAHIAVGHGAADMTLAALRVKYHVVKCGVVVRSVIDKCVICRMARAKPFTPLMAALPPSRLKSHLPPFTFIGVDYFGPFEVIILRRRVKRWGCLFTCLVTRGVHLEIAHSLDTLSFLAAFWRFCCCRGIWPHTVYSDNGTNFTAAEKELLDAILRFNQKQISDALSAKNIQWIFSPPLAPHFGGVWERLVKSAKAALTKVLKNRTVTDEMLLTAMKGAEMLINSRPLTHVSVNPDDLQPLTPFHFLVGHPLYTPTIDADIAPKKANLRRQWEAGQVIVQDFWRAWTHLYVPSVIERRKWLTPRRNLKIGDLVLLADPDLPQGQFPRGRVVEVFPGSDGVVRSVRIRTASGEYERPVVRLALLELDQEEVAEPGNGADCVPSPASALDCECKN